MSSRHADGQMSVYQDIVTDTENVWQDRSFTFGNKNYWRINWFNVETPFTNE